MIHCLESAMDAKVLTTAVKLAFSLKRSVSTVGNLIMEKSNLAFHTILTDEVYLASDKTCFYYKFEVKFSSTKQKRKSHG